MNIQGFYININILKFLFLFHERDIKLKAWFEVTELYL